MNRRRLLKSLAAGVVGVTAAFRVAPVLLARDNRPKWTLDDLQICADLIDQKWGCRVERIVCSHANRRHILRLAEANICGSNEWGVYVGDVKIQAERDIGENALLMYTSRVEYARFSPRPSHFVIRPASREVVAEWPSPLLMGCEG